MKTAEAGPLTGESVQVVTPIEAAGLTTGQTYYYWIVASNASGKEHGAQQTFTPGEPTEVNTEPAEEVTETTAYLSGELNVHGEGTYYFEYGTEPCGVASCGTKTAEEGPVTGETRKVVESIQVTGLKPETTYHYWVVVSNSNGTVHGKDRSFTTGGELVKVVEVPPISEVKIPKKEEVRTPPATKPSVSIVKVKVESTKLLVTVKVSAQGTVRISGTGLKTASETLAVGTHQVVVALTSKGKKERKDHKKIKLSVALKVGSETASASKSVKL